MDTPKQAQITPLNAGVRPRKVEAIAPKRAYVLRPALTYRPFEDIKSLLNATK